MKQPAECGSLPEVRTEIDRLDAQLLDLLAERKRYVQRAAAFKTSAAAVNAPERLAALLQQRRAWAGERGLDPAMVEQLFRTMVQHFIQEEMAQWQASP